MDHMMPGMDGVEAMKRIRSEQAKAKKIVPIIAFTANAVSSAREMFRKEGFDGFVSKPVDRVELERVIKHVLPAGLVVTDNSTVNATFVKNETPPAAPAEKGVIEKLASVGVDVQKGLYYSQNDREFYISLLMQYLKESDKKKTLMDEALKKGDLASYAIQAHSIKSTSKMIGALDLSECARLLEEAGKGGDREYIEANMEEMLKMYDGVLDILRSTNEQSASEPVADAADEDDDILEFGPSGDAGEGGEA